MELLRLTLVQTPRMVQQVVRSYDSNLKGDLLKASVDQLDPRREISSAAVAKIASQLIRPAGQAFNSNIENGWDFQRMRFTMLVRLSQGRDMSSYMFITGYTNHGDVVIGAGNTVTFDPNMRLFFNSTTRIDMVTMNYRNQTVIQPLLKSSDQILNRGVFGNDVSRYDRALLRPTDLVRRAHTGIDNTMFGNGTNGDYHSHIVNSAGTFQTVLTANRRSNNAPSAYLKNTMSGYNKASTDLESSSDLVNWDHGSVLDRTIDHVEENSVMNGVIFDEMSRDSNILSAGFVTYSELLRMSPNFNDRQVGFRPLNPHMLNAYMHSESLRMDTVESLSANIIAQSIIPMMLNANYSRIEGLVINTRVPMGSPRAHLALPHPLLQGVEVASSYDAFLTSVETTLIPDASNNGIFDINAAIDADVDGMITIKISIDGQPEVHFAIPAFADSLISPVLSNNSRQLEIISQDVLSISEAYNNRRAQALQSHAPYVADSADLFRDPFKEQRSNNFIVPPGMSDQNKFNSAPPSSFGDVNY